MTRLRYIVAIIGIALTCIFAEEFYSTRYDDIDIRAVINNPRMRQQYYKCLMEIAPCKTADAKYFKENFYSTLYDDVDVEAILNNPRLRQQYYKCMMDIAPCKTADAKFFKEIFGDAIQTECRKCSEKQKQILDYIFDWYAKNNPVELQTIVAKSLEDLRKKNSKQ